MQHTRSDQKTRHGQRGMSLIELLIALTVLTVGLVAVIGLVMSSVATNNRNRLDTGSTMAAQAILETIAAQPGGSAVTMTDCAGNTFTVNTASPAVGSSPNSSGANLLSDKTGIDFTGQTNAQVPAGYSVMYVGCGPAGSRATYDIRWNIQTITAYSRLITVGAQQRQAVQGRGTSSAGLYFGLPVNLRTISATGN